MKSKEFNSFTDFLDFLTNGGLDEMFGEVGGSPDTSPKSIAAAAETWTPELRGKGSELLIQASEAHSAHEWYAAIVAGKKYHKEHHDAIKDERGRSDGGQVKLGPCLYWSTLEEAMLKIGVLKFGLKTVESYVAYVDAAKNSGQEI